MLFRLNGIWSRLRHVIKPIWQPEYLGSVTEQDGGSSVIRKHGAKRCMMPVFPAFASMTCATWRHLKCLSLVLISLPSLPSSAIPPPTPRPRPTPTPYQGRNSGPLILSLRFSPTAKNRCTLVSCHTSNVG